jgi:tetratricopeptide (TPR) repeat protein
MTMLLHVTIPAVLGRLLPVLLVPCLLALPAWAADKPSAGPAEKDLDPGVRMSLQLMKGPYFKASPEEYLSGGIGASIVGNHRYAVKLLTMAIDSGGLNMEQLAQAYLNRGMARMHINQHRLAVEDLTKALESMPDKYDTYFQLGNALRALGAFTEAIIAYNRALELKPGYAPAYYMRGSVWLIKGDNRLAVNDFSEAIRMRPKMDDAFYLRSQAYEALGEWDKALADLKSFHLLNPLDDSVEISIARLRTRMAEPKASPAGR